MKLSDVVEQLKCQHCSYGIMTFQPGDIEAPCLDCSSDKTLTELYEIRNKAIKREWLEKERKKIRE